MSMADLTDAERVLSPSDVVLSFTIEVLIMEARGIKLPAQKIVYCTMEVCVCDYIRCAFLVCLATLYLSASC